MGRADPRHEGGGMAVHLIDSTGGHLIAAIGCRR